MSYLLVSPHGVNRQVCAIPLCSSMIMHILMIPSALVQLIFWYSCVVFNNYYVAVVYIEYLVLGLAEV